MDTSMVEKFFAVWPEDDREKGGRLKIRAVSIKVIIIMRIVP